MMRIVVLHVATALAVVLFTVITTRAHVAIFLEAASTFVLIVLASAGALMIFHTDCPFRSSRRSRIDCITVTDFHGEVVCKKKPHDDLCDAFVWSGLGVVAECAFEADADVADVLVAQPTARLLQFVDGRHHFHFEPVDLSDHRQLERRAFGNVAGARDVTETADDRTDGSHEGEAVLRTAVGQAESVPVTRDVFDVLGPGLLPGAVAAQQIVHASR